MDWDEARPLPGRTITVGEDLKLLSVAELETRVAALTAEIERCRAEIAAKKAHAAAASDIFRKG
jgi:uncharacterized small protein (DUF1192 family)